MTFLQSIFLTGLAAVSIPLLIHLFSRRKKERVPFSSLYFLKMIESRKIRRLKLKQILLLLLRMAIICLLVFAFARPTIVGDTDGHNGAGDADNTRVTAVFIIDNSLSGAVDVDGKPLYELIREKAIEALETLKDGDEIYVIFAADFDPPPDFKDNSIRPVHDTETAANLIRRSAVSFTRSNLSEALRSSYRLLSRSNDLHREIYLISDMQAVSFAVETGSEPGEILISEDLNNQAPIRVYCINPKPENELSNVGIKDVTVMNEIPEEGKPLTIRTVVQNFGRSTQEDLLVHVFFGGKRMAQKSVSIAPFESESIDFQILPEQTGIVEGVVEIEDDRFLEDNRRYFIITVPAKLSILVINGYAGSNPFLQSVYSPELFSLPPEVRTISEDQVSSVDFRDYDAVLYNGFSRMTQADVYRMRNYCAGGGGVILFPDEKSDLVSFNATIGTAFGLPEATGFVGELAVQTGGMESGIPSTGFLVVDRIDYSHPVFANMFKQIPPDEVNVPQVFRSVRFESRTAGALSSHTIMAMSNSDPFMVEKRIEQGALVLFASAPLLSWTTFPLKGIFSPILHRLVYYFSNIGNIDSNPLEIGDDISFLYSGSAERLTMIQPSGDEFMINPTTAAEAFRIEYSDTDFPGIYTFTSNNEVQRKFPVNVDARESDLRTVSENRLKTLFGDIPFYLWDDRTNLIESISETRSGKEISRYFIAAVMLFLLIESVLQHERTEKVEDEQ